MRFMRQAFSVSAPFRRYLERELQVWRRAAVPKFRQQQAEDSARMHGPPGFY